MLERMLVMIKPDAVARSLVGKIIGRIEERGFTIVGLRILKLSQAQAEELYAMHKNKVFFGRLMKHITSEPVIIMVIEGFEVINGMRKLSGRTDPLNADVGSIRGSYGLTVTKNAIHSAESPEDAKREIDISFRSEEIVSVL